MEHLDPDGVVVVTLQPVAVPRKRGGWPFPAKKWGQPTAIPTRRRASRNDPCPCGSKKKYKRCHGS